MNYGLYKKMEIFVRLQISVYIEKDLDSILCSALSQQPSVK